MSNAYDMTFDVCSDMVIDMILGNNMTPPASGFILLEVGGGYIELENGSGVIQLE